MSTTADHDIDLLFEPVEPVDETVFVPAFRTGRRADLRARRREARQRRGRRVVVVAALAIVVAASGRWLFDTATGARPERDPTPATSAPASAAVQRPRPVLLVLGDAGAAAQMLTLLVVDAEGRGGHVLMIPAGSMLEVPSFGLEAAGHATELGGAALAARAVENLLGVVVDDIAAVSTTQLGHAVTAAGPLAVDVPATVETIDPQGRVDVLFAPGPLDLDAATVGPFLTELGDGSELDAFIRQQAFWEALVSTIADGRRLGSTEGGLGQVDAALHALARGAVAFHTLPVESLGPGLANGGELYKVDRGAVAALVDEILPRALTLADADRIRVQLLNGTGAPGLAQQVTPVLVPAGVEVVIADNADRFDYATTEIVYYDRAELALAQRVREALGVGEVVFSRRPLEVVDITVVVGSDFHA